MTYSALEVARYIVHHEAKQNRSVSNLRLQKLLYFVQAQFAVNATDGQPCFKDRSVGLRTCCSGGLSGI